MQNTAVQCTSNIGINTKSKVPKLKNTLHEYIKHKYLIMLLIPVILWYIIFNYIPIYGIVLAFKEYNFVDGIFKSPWIGFENFRRMISGDSFGNAFKNTVILSAYKLISGFPAPILLAILLNELKNEKFKKFTQTVSYLPHFISWVILGGVFVQLLSPSIGPIGLLFRSLGLKPINFISDTSWFRTVLVSTSVWKGIGWGTIIYLASIAGISQDMYEAAIIDGAGRFKRILNVTLPSLIPVVTIVFILNVGTIINDDFDQIFNLYSPSVYSVGDVLSTYTYRVGLVDMDYGYSTAVGLFKNVISFVLVFGTNTIVKKFNEYSLW